MTRQIWIMLCFVSALVPASTSAESPAGLPHSLPRDLEIEIALSAAPEHLRSEATVYVLGEDGFELARQGSNGFSCLVPRSAAGRGAVGGADHVEPMCYDEEGMKTYGAVALDTARMRRAGVAEGEIRQRIAAGFASGAYRAPTRGGVIYMLSPVNKVPDGRGGVFQYPPHLMFHAPFVTNEQIGVTRELMANDPGYALSGLPFLPVAGPQGFIVVPLGRQEVGEIVARHRDLIETMRRYVTLDFDWQ